MNLTKKMLIIALAAIMAVGSVGLGIGIFVNRPETVMKTSVQNLLTDVFARPELESVSDFMQSGSVEVILGLSAMENEISLEYKEYFGLADFETYIEKVKLNINDFAIDGSAYVGEDYMYVSAPALYDSPIGLVRGKTLKEFEDSLFAFESGTEFELDEEISDSIKIFCRIYDDAKDKEAVKDIEELLKSYVELLVNSIGDHAEIKKENDKIKIHGEQVSAKMITVEIDVECIYNVISDLYDELKRDKRIPKLIKKYGNLAEQYVEGTVLEGELQSHFGEDEDDDFTEVLLDVYDDLLDELDTIVDDMEDAADSADNVNIVVKMATKKSSSDLMAVEVIAKADGEKMKLANIQFGKAGIKKTNKITVDIMGEMYAELAIKQDDKDGYKLEFSVEEGDDVLVNAFAKIDKANGKFTFGASIDGETYEIRGKYEKSGKKHTFDLKDITYTDYTGVQTSLIDSFLAEAGTEDIDFEFKVIICENDSPKPLAKGKVKSAFTLDEDDFEDVKIAIEELIEEAKSAMTFSETSTESVAPYVG